MPTDKSVLGDFDDATFDYYGVRSRFFRKDGKFFVETDGPDGKLATFEVKYTFGVDPLQQYLIEFPDGRLQALSLAWDSRPKDQGGQRWFHLYPDEEIKHDDVLHWTRLNQNWNFMCAECHSTGVRKNYDAATDRFATTLGGNQRRLRGLSRPGLAARRLGAGRSKAGGRSAGAKTRAKGCSSSSTNATMSPGRSIRRPATRAAMSRPRRCARRSRPAACVTRAAASSPRTGCRAARCRTRMSSRRSRAGSISADGQMLDEVYNYGSFKQSKMFAAGVTCSDCHEPHAAKLRAPGDGVCLQCHAAGKYAAVAHHRHATADPALACASCHMPARTYMVVDRRHDHSFRIPRPDLSVTLGTPNACNDCHRDKPATWAAAAIESWHGPVRRGFQSYAEAFHAARTDHADAAALLAVVAADQNTPGIARATALSELGAHPSASIIPLARRAFADPDPMVRIGALDMLGNLPASQIWPLVSPLLSDSNRGVRIGRPRCSPRFRRRASLRPTGLASRVQQPSLSPRNGSTPIGPKRVPRSDTSTRGAAYRWMPKLNTRPRCA